MAQLGIRTFDELIGRADLLDTRKGIAHWKASGLDFSRVFHQPQVPAEVPRHQVEEQDHGLDKALDVKLIEKCRPAIETRREGAVHGGGAQRQPHGRRDAVGRADPPASRGPARPHHLHPDGRHGRPELRRLPGQGHHAVPDRRRQRLHRQGPVGRARGGAPEHRLPRRRDEEHHRRQHRALRRDQRRGVLPRRRRRALRGAPVGRHRGGRGHRRPWLRVHDRRHGGRARQDRAQLRGRHVGRHRLRLRRGRPVRQALQHRDGRAREGAAPRTSRKRRSIARCWHSGTDRRSRCCAS